MKEKNNRRTYIDDLPFVQELSEIEASQINGGSDSPQHFAPLHAEFTLEGQRFKMFSEILNTQVKSIDESIGSSIDRKG